MNLQGGRREAVDCLTLAHGIHNAKDVHIVGRIDLLQDPIQCDEGARSANACAAVHQYGTLFGTDAISESANESYQRLRRIRYTEIWPSDEMEMAQDALLAAL